MERPVIRLATIEDLPWNRRLWREMVTEQPTPPYPTNLVGSIDTFTRSIALALTQSPPVAFVFIAQLPTSPTPDAFLAYEIQTRTIGLPERIAFVHYIYTTPSARGHGLSTTLSELSAEHMMAQGLDTVEATTAPGDARFHDLGFVPYEVRVVAPLAGIATQVAARRRLGANGHDPTVSPFEVPPPVVDPAEDDND